MRDQRQRVRGSADAYDRFDMSIRQGVAGGCRLGNSEDVSTDSAEAPSHTSQGPPSRGEGPPEEPHGPAWHRDLPFSRTSRSGVQRVEQAPTQITFYANTGNQGLQFAAVGA